MTVRGTTLRRIDARVGSLRRRVVAAASGAALLAVAAHSGVLPARGSRLADAPAVVLPGPSLLHAPPPRAPQLENTGAWQAEPILVSGTMAYRSHELVHQDHLYDDLGALDTATYPTDRARYVDNVADLVEVRLKRSGGHLAVRLTFNSMTDPWLVGTTIALGDGPAVAVPYAAGATSPGRHFVTVRGATADVRAASGEVLRTDLPVDVDLERRQVTVRVPVVADQGPRLRVAVAAGLWDRARDGFLLPRSAADETHPGAGQLPGCAYLNVAFRFGETGPWATARQAEALNRCDLSPFSAEVDLAKLDGPDDDLVGTPQGVPRAGRMTRIYASRFDLGQGRKPGPDTLVCDQPCGASPTLRGQLQPYVVDVPEGPAPPGGFGTTLSLHACTGTLHQAPIVATDVTARRDGSILLAPEARGPCHWYWGAAAADVFEAWADVLRRYPVDLSRSTVVGHSMGGYGAYKLAGQYPDLFAAVVTGIGCTSAGIGWRGGPDTPGGGEAAAVRNLVASLRAVPILAANAADDALCTPSAQRELRDALHAAGGRYDWREYAGHHAPFFLTPAEAAAFLEAHPLVEPDPARVTLTYSAAMDEAAWGLDAGHAHWVSSVVLRDPTVPTATGTVDLRSLAFGVTDPAPAPAAASSGRSGEVPYAGWTRTWLPGPPAPPSDALDIRTANVASLTIDARRARVTCKADLQITSDGPLDVRWLNCP